MAIGQTDGAVERPRDLSSRVDVLSSYERGMFETVQIPLLLLQPVRDLDGHIGDMEVVAGNAAAAEVNGVAPNALPGLRLRRVVETMDQQELLDAYIEVAENGGALRRQVPWQHDGRVWAVFDISARAVDGHVLVSFRDVMDNESTQLELRRVNERLHAAERELAARAAAHRDFVAVASHELRTPLATLRGFAEILRDHGDELGSAAATSALDAILRNVERQTRIVDGLVDASTIAAGEPEVRHYRLDVAQVLREALTAVPPLVGRTVVEVEDGLTVLGDEQRLVQVVVALLTNAAKYGGPHVRIVARADRDVVRVSVEDDGAGVDHEFEPSLFDMFSQSGDALRRTARGTGLGLALARGFAEAMDGTIEHRHRDGGGAVFTVSLPRV